PPVQEQRSLNQQQGVSGSRSAAYVRSPIVRLRAVRIIDGVVNAVDFARLSRTRGRRQSKVGITAGFAQNIELIVNPTPAAVRPRIIERPISVNESVCQLPRVAVAR